jgi:hypothetical protein
MLRSREARNEKKSRQEVFNEWMDKSYGAGVGLEAGIKTKQTTRQNTKDNKGDK